MNKGHLVISVIPGSICDEGGIVAGDRLVSINGLPIVDVFDYRPLTTQEFLSLEFELQDGEILELEIEKDEDEDLGLVFENDLMDKPRDCENRCIFCFIDQLPSGLRKPLYFKDDDFRLGFLSGNYVSLTNLSENELNRLITHRLSPVNISVHTTDMKKRARIMGNKQAGKLMDQLNALYNAGIGMNFQIVLMPGENDGESLSSSIRELSRFIPMAQSLSVVPVGLTRHREGKYPLRPFNKAEARAVIDTVRGFWPEFLDKYDTRFVFAADEFYIKSGQSLPAVAEYEEFFQLENGVGMLSLFLDELNNSLPNGAEEPAILVSATAAAPFVQKAVGRQAEVVTVKNDFFGHEITVTGLLTGADILKSVKGKIDGRPVIIPGNALRDDGLFLDDMSLGDLEKYLGAKIFTAGSGIELARLLKKEFR